MTEHKNKIHIVYFTGTGGTGYAADTLTTAFKDKNYKVYCSELLQSKLPSINENETLVLMFPVYAADAPHVIYRWIASLTKVISQKAVVVSVSGGGEISPNTACRMKSVRRLIKKGYQVDNEYSLCMPSNFIMPTHDILAINLLKILPGKCEIIVNEVTGNIKRRKKVNFIDRIILLLCHGEKIGSKIAGRLMRVTDDCNGCGLCAIQCPKSNITMKDNRPEYHFSCELCLRCVYLCPKKAVKLRILKRFVLKEGFNINSYIKKIHEDTLISEEGIPDGFLWKGIVSYLQDINIL
ncbi:MAG: EFR1 family ferrodoxin [Clostridia bacterium]|nr:EFR1 family ferrodoxin [Clostridia bacterium]